MSNLDKYLIEQETEEFLKEAMLICKKKLSNVAFMNHADKEDAVQIAMMKVAQALKTYDRSKGMASTYFNKVIENGINSYMRTAIKHAPLTSAMEIVDEYTEDDGFGNNKVSVYDDTTVFNASNIIIDFIVHIGLTEREKKIFELRRTGYDFVEIAYRIGCSKARVSQIWKGIINKYYRNLSESPRL